METYIKFGGLTNDFHARKGIFSRKTPSTSSIEAMHEACFNLPDGYHQDDIYPHLKMYTDSIDTFWPSGINERILTSKIMNARNGPPDWVSGPEGITYTCEDVTISVRTRLPIPEGCLNSDM